MKNKKYSIFSCRITQIILSLIIITSSAQLTIEIGSIPITAQTLAILSIALLFKPLDTFIILFMYLLLGIIGVPVFADGAHGISKITGSSGGFLIGFLIAGTFISYLYHKYNSKSFSTILGLTILGSVLILLSGNIRLASLYGIEKALTFGLYPFWKGAIIKILFGSAFVYYAERVFD